jgi:hypothetical protein
MGAALCERGAAHEEAIEGLKERCERIEERCEREMGKMQKTVDDIKGRANVIVGGVAMTFLAALITLIIKLVEIKNGS